jgi:transposase
MTNPPNHIEVVTSVQRPPALDSIREGSHGRGDLRAGHDDEPGGSPTWRRANQLFTWRRLVAQGSLTAAGSGEEVVPASDYRALHNQVRELHRLLGKKTLEVHDPASKGTAKAGAFARRRQAPLRMQCR